MESYMIMLYVTIEQEIELKKFFMNRGWPYCKTDLSMMTDHIGPLTGQVPHLTRQTLGLGPSLSPMSVQESQLAQLEASKKRAAEHEAEMPPAKKLVLEPSPVSSPPATAAPPLVTQEPVKVETSAAPVSVGMVPVTPTTGGDAGSQQLQHQGRAGSIPQRLSQEKDIVLDQEPVKVKTEPNTGEIKTYSKVPQRPPVTPAEDKSPTAKVQTKPVERKIMVVLKEGSPTKQGTPLAVTPAGVKIIPAPNTPGSGHRPSPGVKPAAASEVKKPGDGTIAQQEATFYQRKQRETTFETIIVPCPGPVVNPNPTERGTGMQSYMKTISRAKVQAKKGNMKVALQKDSKKKSPLKKTPAKDGTPEKGRSGNRGTNNKSKGSNQSGDKKATVQRAASESPKKAANGKLKTLKAAAVKRAAAVGVKKAAINPAKKYRMMMQTRRQTMRPKRIIKTKTK